MSLDGRGRDRSASLGRDTRDAGRGEPPARLFVALLLPETTRASLRSATEPLRAGALPVRWTPAHQLHITLRFLGSVEPGRIERVGDAVERTAAAVRPLHLVLRDIGAFPSLSRARVVWVGVEPDPGLADLHGRLTDALEPLGFPREERLFHAHVTLGRARPRRGLSGGALEEAAGAVRLRVEADVAHVHLMRSRLGPGGARHTVEVACPLGSDAPD